MPQLVFSYGSLRNREIQLRTFGRQLSGREDSLPGHVMVNHEPLPANLLRSSNPGDEVAGMVFEITQEELAAADEYEAADGYRRVSVTLQSGLHAWVYMLSS